MLDSSAQRQKAALGHAKGLQERRLPSQYADKVSDDYRVRRRSYNPLLSTSTTASNKSKSVGDLGKVSLTEEEKEQQVKNAWDTSRLQ